MENDGRQIIARLVQCADPLQNAWPDDFGRGYARWLLKCAQNAGRISSKMETLNAQAESIRRFCRQVLEEDSDDAKTLSLHRWEKPERRP